MLYTLGNFNEVVLYLLISHIPGKLLGKLLKHCDLAPPYVYSELLVERQYAHT